MATKLIKLGNRVRITAPSASAINVEIEKILGRKAESVTKNNALRKQLAETYKVFVTPYVPMRTGKLRNSAKVTNEAKGPRIIWSATNKGKKYNANYAGLQYQPWKYLVTNNWRNWHYTTPGTGPEWDKVFNADTDAWESFISEITPSILEAYKNG